MGTLAEAKEHGLDQLRIHDEHGLQPELVIDDDRLLVEIAPQLATGLETTRASSKRNGSRPSGGFGTMVASNDMVP
jgi:hypothetical protein